MAGLRCFLYSQVVLACLAWEALGRTVARTRRGDNPSLHPFCWKARRWRVQRTILAGRRTSKLGFPSLLFFRKVTPPTYPASRAPCQPDCGGREQRGVSLQGLQRCPASHPVAKTRGSQRQQIWARWDTLCHGVEGWYTLLLLTLGAVLPLPWSQGHRGGSCIVGMLLKETHCHRHGKRDQHWVKVFAINGSH